LTETIRGDILWIGEVPTCDDAMRWYNSLIFKIILCCVVLTFCLIGSIFGVLYRYQHSILSEMEQRSSEILEAIQVDLTNLEVEEISENTLQSRLPDLKDRHGVDAILLYDSERDVVTSIRSDETPLLGFGDPRAYVANIEGLGGKKTTRYLQTLPLMIGSKQVGFVRIMLDIVPQTHLIKALQSKILIVLILLFLGTIAALCYFIFKLLQPLRAMATTCREISEGNLHEIDVKPNASEVLVLEMKFNEMVGSLKTKAEMEQKLARTQRLSALGNLAAGVAHEIGNPLNGIKLTLSHLKDISSKHELDEASFDKYAQSMLNEVNRLDRIVKDFLMLAKERELSLCPYEMDRLIEETLRLIDKEAKKRGIIITSNIPAITREVLIDPQLLKSAILNLLINAMEASDKNGSINVSLAESDRCSVVKVVDEGKGIPEDIIGQAFEPYFSTKFTGTGLGLSLTKTIIEKHGGEISLESQNGQGTTATFTIPIEGK
jgi:signal transduction histidine kinase